MTRVTIQEYAAALRSRYQAARRRDKKRMLDEFCQTTGLHRKSAIRMLNRELRPRLVRTGRPRRYGPEVLEPLRLVWETGDRMCGKLLVGVMPTILAGLERYGELNVRAEVRELLLSMSASTIDRLLKKQSIRLSNRRPESHPRPPQNLKRTVPVKTWSEWDNVQPGSLQADLVFHSGESLLGFHLTTLCAVDVATGWIELQPVWGLGKSRVGAAIHLLRQRLPFVLKALHTDNGSEFLNDGLIPWCQREGIRLTRGRPYKKNDQAWVEQRNWQSVRRYVGYERYSTKAAYELLLKLYPLLCLQMNFLRPVRKLVSKERQGAKVSKRYDEPRTPYQRLVASGILSEQAQARTDRQLQRLNPADLQRRINQLLSHLWQQADRWKGGRLVSVG
jgi:predicted DNA-binding transcriptional regulator AlpA